MSKNLSLKLQDDIFEETERVLRKLKRPRNAYINEAIHFYNKLFARRYLKTITQGIIIGGRRLYGVLKEFEQFEEVCLERQMKLESGASIWLI